MLEASHLPLQLLDLHLLGRDSLAGPSTSTRLHALESCRQRPVAEHVEASRADAKLVACRVDRGLTGDRLQDAWGSNYAKLVGIKSKWDPGNVFRTNKNIPPSS